MELNGIIEPLTQRSPPKGRRRYPFGQAQRLRHGRGHQRVHDDRKPEQAYDLIRLGQQVLDRLEALACPTVASSTDSPWVAVSNSQWPATIASRSKATRKDSRSARGAARHSPGFRGHCPCRADMRRARRHAAHADGKPDQCCEKGRQAGTRRSISDDWRGAAQQLIARRKPEKKAPLGRAHC